MKKNKFVVYTAIFGDYDDLIEPKEKYKGCDFICFTDQTQLKSHIWEIRLIPDIDLPPNIMNRKYKILTHEFLSDYSQSLYVDANIFIIANPLELAKKYLNKYDIAIPMHQQRDCIYQEAEVVIQIKKANFEEVEKQMIFYKNQGYPHKFGLTENNIIFRNHINKNIIELMENWFNELKKFSKRDQLSLMYLIWKNNISIIKIKENSKGSKYFRLKLHKKFVKNNSSFISKLKNFKNEHIINFPNGRISTLDSLLRKILPKCIKKLLRINKRSDY